MFQEHRFAVWGTKCLCGQECSVLQNGHHPWTDTDFAIRMTCPSCGREVLINQQKAADFFNQKIDIYYDDVSGTVLDFGCGGGFLSRYLLLKDEVEKIVGLDVDMDSLNETADIRENAKFSFKRYDGISPGVLFEDNAFDFLVSRDVFMFVEDTETYFEDVSRIIAKGIRQIGWYMPNNSRMKNQLEPGRICEEYRKHGWLVHMEELNWYPCGYFITADKPTCSKSTLLTNQNP